MRSFNILCLGASIGAGHERAAAAVGAAFKRLEPSCTIQYLDILSFFPRPLVSVGRRCYLRSLSICPGLYAGAYAWGNGSAAALRGRAWLGDFLAARLQRYAARFFMPQAIVCTHAAAAAAVAAWLTAERLPLYHAGVVTDFVVHRFWMQPSIDDYFVADEKMRAPFLQEGIAAARVHGFGIPVAAPFQTCAARQEKNASAKKDILVMGGGEGLLPMLPILTALQNVPLELRLIFVAGRNERLRRALLARAEKSRCETTVFGFAENISALMCSADLMVSKAGGMSASEALCVGLPLLFYRPLPGQERGNADFLTAAGAAREAENTAALSKEIDKIFRTDPTLGRMMRQRALALAKPSAAERIAEHILNKICL